MDVKSLDVYCVGCRAWFMDEQEGWVLGILSSCHLAEGQLKMVFKLSHSQKVDLFILLKFKS